MFRKYDCGCIAINNDDNIWVIKPCDLDGNHPSEIAMHRRQNLSGKEFTALSRKHIDDLLVEIAELIADGNGLRNLKNTIKNIGLV